MTLNLIPVLANLCSGQYYQAASKLTQMESLTTQNKDLARLVTGEDLAFYLVLVCLAAFNRKEIKERVLENS